MTKYLYNGVIPGLLKTVVYVQRDGPVTGACEILWLVPSGNGSPKLGSQPVELNWVFLGTEHSSDDGSVGFDC